MELGRARIRRHRIILFSLCSVFGIMMFLTIGILMASEIITISSAKTPEISWSNDFDDLGLLTNDSLEYNFDKIADNYQRSAGTIYLTFDDGPGAYTARLLDILKQYNVKATFFVTGGGDDSLIIREYQEGHTVGLHTWSHRYDQLYRSVDAYFEDLQLVHDRVQALTGVDSKIIRFPGGSSNTVSAKYDGKTKIMSTLTQEVGKRGYVYFDWNIASGDAGNVTTTDGVYNTVVSHLHDGVNVILQHDIKSYSVDAVEKIIKFGLDNGYTFEPLTVNSPTVHHGVNN